MLHLHRKAILLLAMLLLGAATRATGQPARQLSDRAQVSILTILPGDAVYSAFGHTAIRVRDAAAGVNRIYNYGTFDFRDPMFLPKFTYGQLDYFLSTATYPRAIQRYRALRRPVIEQELDLTPAQRRAVFRFLEINRRPENRFYRYDFLFDNCSTRIRDVLEDVLGDTLRFPASRMPPTGSFRHMLDPYVADRPAVDFGFDLALGTPTDRQATPREAMFLPRYLMRALDEAQVDGTPLVAERDTVFWLPERSFAPTPSLPWAQILGWMLLALGLADAAWRLRRGRRLAGRADAALFGALGVMGLVICFLWFVSEHYVTNRNWNLLWAWPTHLWAAWRIARKPLGEGLQRYLALTTGAALVTVVLWPFWPQDLHVAALPLVLLIAVRAGGRWLSASYRPRSAHSELPN